MDKVYRQWKIQYKWEHPFLSRSEFSFDKYLKWKRNRTKRYKEWKILKERMNKKGIKD